MTLTLTFQLELRSSYHISAGHGLGTAVDSALLRDVDGVPVLRGTTLVGLLRDSLWRLLRLKPLQKYILCNESGLRQNRPYSYCIKTEEQPDVCPICRLMGNPRYSKRWQVSSARPVDLRQPLAGELQAGTVGAQRVQRARINLRTRRTEPRHLFSQEEGRKALTFQFTISTQASGSDVTDDAALWVAAARNIRQLGRSRRRGQGECIITLTEVSGTANGLPTTEPQQWFLKRLGEKWLTGNPEPVGSAARSITVSSFSTTTNSPYRLRLVARTDEPLIIARRAEAGNQFETLPAITGQVLRGALAWRAARRFDLSDQDTDTYRAFVQLFLRGMVTFPQLHPAACHGNRYYPTIPAPRNWLSCKTVPGLPGQDGTIVGHGLHGGLEPVTEDSCPVEGCESALNPLDGFIVLNQVESVWTGEKFIHHVKQRNEMHVSINPNSNRANEGDLFSYQTLEAGQYFTGELRCESKAAWELLQKLCGLNQDELLTFRMGKASRRGYGKCTLWLTEMASDAPGTLTQQPLDRTRLSATDNITLTLLTDTIIVDTWGRFENNFSETWLSKAFGGLKLRLIDDSICVQTQMIDGFNAYLGLPRWRDMALKAGSATRFRLVDPPDDWRETLTRIEQNGIGLRRNEGFGQIAFNHPIYRKCGDIQRDQYGRLPRPMRLVKDASHPLAEESAFQDHWREILNEKEDWDKACKHYYFTAVARWLNAQANTSPEELAIKIDKLGKPEDDLIRAIGPEEYGDREAQDKLQKEHGGGLKLIKEQLKALSDEEQTHWPLGIRLLAERVADSVKNKGDNL